VARSAIALDRVGQILTKTAVQKVIVVAYLEAGFGKKIREILFRIFW
jgi:energy-converting hydrogenase Eha subunit C